MSVTIEKLDLAPLGIDNEDPAEIWLLRGEDGRYSGICRGGESYLACFKSAESAVLAEREVVAWSGHAPVLVTLDEAREVAKSRRKKVIALAWRDSLPAKIFHYVR